MIKTLIYAATFGLTAAAAVPIAYGSSVTAPAKVPRIVSSVQFPQSRWKIVRHTFRLQIPQESKPLSQLTISVPAGLTVKNKVLVILRFIHVLETNRKKLLHHDDYSQQDDYPYHVEYSQQQFYLRPEDYSPP